MIVKYSMVFPVVLALISAAALLNPSSSFSATALREVTSPEDAVGRAVGGHILVDQDGKRFDIKELLGERPLVVSYVYTSCTHTCTPILAKLKRAFDEAGKDFGTKFAALTIGFDAANDTPQALKKYGGNFTEDFKRWRFATGGQRTMDDIVKDTGFYYEKDASGGFEHINLVTVVGSDGRIAKQIYITTLTAREVLEAIRSSLFSGQGRLAGPVEPASGPGAGLLEKVKLFCYSYDAASGRYRLNYGAIATLALITLLQGITIGWIIYIVRKKKTGERAR